MSSLPPAYRDLEGQRILVTGAAGFIGGDLFHRLSDYGCDVTATVLYPEELETLRESGHKAELLDLVGNDGWDEILTGIDLVFHVAAMFQETEHGEALYRRANCDGALKLAQAAERLGVKRFVHCSTAGVHGSVKEIPCKETTPNNPMDHYHRTKLAGEIAILEFARTLPDDGMTVTVNRPSMVYGPGDMRMLKIFRAILRGSFRMIGSGNTLAHLDFIEDQTDTFLLCAVAPRETVHLEVFNIASNEPMTLNELAAMIAEEGGVTLSKLKIPVAPVWFAGLLNEMICKPFGASPFLFRRRVGFFTHDRAFDLSKAREKLGYESKPTHREAIAKTIAWYREKGLV